MLWRITAPHFVAGFEAWEYVQRTAPIIKYMNGWSVEKVITYCRAKNWDIVMLDPIE